MGVTAGAGARLPPDADHDDANDGIDAEERKMSATQGHATKIGWQRIALQALGRA
jgi:hypothetical protein